MSYVIAAPELMTAAAGDLAGIGSSLSEAHAAAAIHTVALVPAAADEVSAGVAHLFSGYAEDFHGLAGRAAAFQEQFVGHLKAGAGSYAAAEGVNASLLRPLIDELLTRWGERNTIPAYVELQQVVRPFLNPLRQQVLRPLIPDFFSLLHSLPISGLPDWRTNELYSLALRVSLESQDPALAQQFASYVASAQGPTAAFLLLTGPITIPLWWGIYFRYWSDPGGFPI
jgi:hypothetical protein